MEVSERVHVIRQLGNSHSGTVAAFYQEIRMKSSGLCSGGEASFRSSPRVPNRVLRESLKKIDPVTTDSVPVLPRYEEADMRSSTLICMITGVAVLMALALPFQLAAQQTRYKIIDLGPLG